MRRSDSPTTSEISFSPTVAIVSAIAEAKGVAVEELTLTLYDYIDPETLDELYERDNVWFMQFVVDDYFVCLNHEEEVEVIPLADR